MLTSLCMLYSELKRNGRSAMKRVLNARVHVANVARHVKRQASRPVGAICSDMSSRSSGGSPLSLSTGGSGGGMTTEIVMRRGILAAESC